MWFKNLYLLKLPKGLPVPSESLEDELSKKQFAPCLPTQRESVGWIAPLGKGTSALAHTVNGFTLISMARQERLLPASVIREELEEQVEQIESAEGRKVSFKEKRELRENIEHELLPKAFLRTNKMDAWIDLKGGWLVIDSASASKAEVLTKLLCKTLGSLPVEFPETVNDPVSMMTNWIKDGWLMIKSPSSSNAFDMGNECVLKSNNEDKSIAVFRNQHLLDEEVLAGINDGGKQAVSLSLSWEDKISFILTDELQVKKIKFLDIYAENLDKESPETKAEEVDIKFALMSGEVAEMVNDLIDVLGGLK